MNTKEIGNYIKKLRTSLNMTQKELADSLNISFQAVSKWENGETLPDTALLLDLADRLKTTTDNILNGGTTILKQYKRINVSDVIQGFAAFESVKNYFGVDSTFYQGMVEGINDKMQIDIEGYLANSAYREILYAEVILQAIQFEHAYVDLEEVKSFFKNEKMIQRIEDASKKYNR